MPSEDWAERVERLYRRIRAEVDALGKEFPGQSSAHAAALLWTEHLRSFALAIAMDPDGKFADNERASAVALLEEELGNVKAAREA